MLKPSQAGSAGASPESVGSADQQMSAEPVYPVARTVATLVAAHLAQHRATVDAASAVPATADVPRPDASVVGALVDAAFWASLRREEGYVWWHDDRLAVWGTTRTIPPFCFVVEVIAPGLIVLKHRPREERTTFLALVSRILQLPIFRLRERCLYSPHPSAPAE
jgi:hypothetical protein